MTTHRTSEINRVLIIAAGQGSRLQHHTAECPKCMVKVDGTSIITQQLFAFSQNNIHDIHIVRGYLAEKLIVEGATNYLNSDYKNNNILHSAMTGLAAFDQPLLTTYSDIVFTPEVVRQLLDTPGDIVLTVDRQWAKAYEGRNDHPVEQAELTEISPNGDVQRVGKWVGPEHAVGEFIGLAKFSKKGAHMVREVWKELLATISLETPFRHASHFRLAYLTDLFEELIERGVSIQTALIDGGWREIDTVEDLERVSKSWKNEI